MDKTQQNLFRNNDLKARKAPSKVVSDAFGFLNNKTYSDKDGIVRIQSSYSESSLAYMDPPEKPGDLLQTDVYIPDDTEEYTIVTSVEKSPQPKHKPKPDGTNANSVFLCDLQTNQNHVGNRNDVRRESLPTMFLANTPISEKPENHKNQTSDNEIHATNKSSNKDEFIIVDYLEDYNKRSNTGIVVAIGNHNSQTETVTDTLSGDSLTTKSDNKEKLNVNADDELRTDDNEEKRRSVNIGSEVVELRSDRNTKPARAPTWKQNQMIVSEAFNFLQDLEGGDTISVIGAPVEDRSDADSNRNIDSTHDKKGNNALSGKVNSGLSSIANDSVINHAKNSIPKNPYKTSANVNSFGKSTNLSSFGKPLSPTSENRVSSDLDSVPNSPDRFSVSSERDDQLGELGASRLRQRRKSPRKDSDDDDDGDSSDEDRGELST